MKKNIYVIMLFAASLFGTAIKTQAQIGSEYVPYQHDYTYRTSKWYTYLDVSIVGGVCYEKSISGGYYKNGVKTDFESYGDTKWKDFNSCIAIERLYRSNNLFIGPGAGITLADNGQFAWDLYGRSRVELSMGRWLGSSMDFLHLYATAAAGASHLSGSASRGYEYFLWYSSVGRTMHGNIGSSLLDSGFTYNSTHPSNAKAGFVPYLDFGVGFLMDFRGLIPKSRPPRTAYAIGYRAKLTPRLCRLLNLDDYQDVMDNLIGHYPYHQVVNFDEHTEWCFFHGIEMSFRF